MDVNPAWRTEAEARVAELQEGHDDITHVRVTITVPPGHRKPEHETEALVVLTVPERHTITARKHAKAVEEAMRLAFDAAEVEVREYRDKLASKEVRVPPLLRGVISKLLRDEGYGFILDEEGREIYFHQNAVHEWSFEQLEDGEDGMDVALNVEDGEKGLQANTVKPPPIVPRA